MVTLRLAAGIVATLAFASPAAAETISGKLASGTAKLPKSASAGQAQVLALDIDTMAYGGAASVGRNGSYKLSLPAGKWALRTAVEVLGKRGRRPDCSPTPQRRSRSTTRSPC
jgi:hypothetical protein